eukprot:803291-Amorphochlora_amoeboformis.AAC.1
MHIHTESILSLLSPSPSPFFPPYLSPKPKYATHLPKSNLFAPSKTCPDDARWNVGDCPVSREKQ